MLLATGQFTSKFFMNIKKPKKPNPQILFPEQECKAEKRSPDFF